MLKSLQYGLGFLIGFFAVLIVAIAAIAGIESVLGSAVPYKVFIVLVPSLAAGVLASQRIAAIDLSRLLPERPAAAPLPPPAARRKRPRRPWSFYMVGTLTLFWLLSLLAIIILFGPFGLQDNFSTPVRLLKIVATTVVIAGLGAFLLRKELMKLMSGPAK